MADDLITDILRDKRAIRDELGGNNTTVFNTQRFKESIYAHPTIRIKKRSIENGGYFILNKSVLSGTDILASDKSDPFGDYSYVSIKSSNDIFVETGSSNNFTESSSPIQFSNKKLTF